MVGQPIISVIMVTIGLASVLDGLMYLTPYASSNNSYPVNFSGSLNFAGISLSSAELFAVAATLIFLGGFTYFFNKSTMGVSMRAVSDDQMAAMSVGTSVQRVFALAWAAAGLSAAAAGLILGLKSGLSLAGLAGIGLKVFPVVILGGLDSVLGAVVGGIIIGIVENLASGYLDTLVPGGGTGAVLPFLVLLVVLLVKPYGLFGTKEIERV